MTSVSIKWASGSSAWSTAATKSLSYPKLTIQNSNNIQYQTAGITVKDPADTDWKTLSINDKCIIEIDSTEEFRGYIARITRQYDGCPTLQIQCVGLTYDLFRYITDNEKTYADTADMTTGEIVEALYDDYIAPYETWTKNITTATGQTITSPEGIIFDKWRVGDAIAHLADMDGYRFFVDWDSVNSRKRLNYYLPDDTPTSILVFSDDPADSPDRLILDESHYEESDENIKNQVVVEGGTADYESTVGTETYNIGVSVANGDKISQIFKATDTKLSGIKIPMVGTTTSTTNTINIKIYKNLYNVARWDVTPSISDTFDEGTYTNCKDEDTSTYSGWNSVPTSGVRWLKYDLGSAKNVAGFYVKSTYEDDYASVKVQYSTDGSTWTDYYSLTQSQATNGLKYLSASAISARYWRLRMENGTVSSYNMYIYEFDIFVEGYGTDTYVLNIPWEGQSELLSKTVILDYNTSWDGYQDEWIDVDVDLTSGTYYNIVIEADIGSFDTKDSNDVYSYGRWLKSSTNYIGWESGNGTASLIFKVGYNYGKPYGTASNSTSQTNYGIHPFVLRNDKLSPWDIVKQYADYLASTYTSPTNRLYIGVEGIGGISLTDKVQVTLNKLSTGTDLQSQKFEVQGYRHEISPNGKWFTYLELGDPQYRIIDFINKVGGGWNIIK